MTYVRPNIYTNKFINIPDFRLCYPCKCLARYARSPITCIVLLLLFSFQAVTESCYYGTEIPLPCYAKLKNWTLFSVASVLEVKIIHIKIV